MPKCRAESTLFWRPGVSLHWMSAKDSFGACVLAIEPCRLSEASALLWTRCFPIGRSSVNVDETRAHFEPLFKSNQPGEVVAILSNHCSKIGQRPATSGSLWASIGLSCLLGGRKIESKSISTTWLDLVSPAVVMVARCVRGTWGGKDEGRPTHRLVDGLDRRARRSKLLVERSDGLGCRCDGARESGFWRRITHEQWRFYYRSFWLRKYPISLINHTRRDTENKMLQSNIDICSQSNQEHPRWPCVTWVSEHLERLPFHHLHQISTGGVECSLMANPQA